MKSVLIIAPHFAPESHAAVFRAHKLAKYLPDHGWKPYVLTVDTNYLYNDDPGLLTELPDEVEIVRTRYIEPTIRGARMALGGRERTFSAMKGQLLQDVGEKGDRFPISTPSVRSAARAIGSGAYRHVRGRLLDSPDAYWTWRRPALRAARELIARHGIEVVYTTSMPYTSHRIGRALKRDSGVKWVADFRDPAGYGRKFSSSIGRIRDIQQEIVRDTLRHADVVTATSSSYALIFADMYGKITKRPIEFIPTGVDDALIPTSTMPPAKPYIVYVGEVMPDQGRAFFEILARAFQTHREHRLVVVGQEIMNRQRLAPILERYGLVGRVEFIDHSPQAEVYRLIAGARAGVLAPGRNSYWWNNHAKLVDYVGLRKPVLALVPDPSEARSVLRHTGLGIFLDGEPERATATLNEFLKGNLVQTDPVALECNRYLASAQVDTFVETFESLR